MGLLGVSLLALAACGGQAAEALEDSPPATATTISDTTLAAGPDLPTVGEAVPFEGGTVTLVSVHRDTETDAQTLTNRNETGSYLVGEFLVQATDNVTVSGWEFSASDPGGSHHKATYTTLQDTFEADLTAGRQAHGFVEFDIPKGDNFIDWPTGQISWKVSG